MHLSGTTAHGTSKRTTTSTGSKDFAFETRLESRLSPLPFGRIVEFGIPRTRTELCGALSKDLQGLNCSFALLSEFMVLTRSHTSGIKTIAHIGTEEVIVGFQCL